MVQLKSYYSLCPLIDRRSFIGVSEDKDQGCGIVTLGKNVVNLYKLSDQKQTGGWTSKEHITAPVMFDNGKNEYVGIFNETTVKTWQRHTQTLDKLKKKKFSKHIWGMTKDSSGNIVIVFKDGDSASLVYAIDARKSLDNVSIIDQNETIVNMELFSLDDINYIGLILKLNNNFSFVSYKLNTDVNTPVLDTIRRVHLRREELQNGKILGLTISAKTNPPQLYALWSDGRLYVNDLKEDKFNLVGHVPWICHSLEVSMSWIGGKHLAIYGADYAQEGAVLSVYNVLFGVGTCSHPLKLFCNGARLWCIWDYILLEASQHLAIVPFILDNHRNMIALIGSDRTDQNLNEMLLADWGKGKTCWKSKESWNEMALKGISEREISISYFPGLINEHDTKSIKASLEKLIDIPENIIVELLLYVIGKSVSNDTNQQSTIGKISFINEDLEFTSLLNTILSLPFVQENMVSVLRKILPLQHVLHLIGYICNALQDKNTDVEFETKLILWATVLLDSHYQQLLLSNNSGTKEVLTHLECKIINVIDQLQEEQSLIPLLNSYLSGKDANKSNLDETSAYFIEAVRLHGL